MDPRDAATMALVAGPAVALGSALAVLGVVRLVARLGRRRTGCETMGSRTPSRKD